MPSTATTLHTSKVEPICGSGVPDYHSKWQSTSLYLCGIFDALLFVLSSLMSLFACSAFLNSPPSISSFWFDQRVDKSRNVCVEKVPSAFIDLSLNLLRLPLSSFFTFSLPVVHVDRPGWNNNNQTVEAYSQPSGDPIPGHKIMVFSHLYLPLHNDGLYKKKKK